MGLFPFTPPHCTQAGLQWLDFDTPRECMRIHLGHCIYLSVVVNFIRTAALPSVLTLRGKGWREGGEVHGHLNDA